VVLECIDGRGLDLDTVSGERWSAFDRGQERGVVGVFTQSSAGRRGKNAALTAAEMKMSGCTRTVLVQST